MNRCSEPSGIYTDPNMPGWIGTRRAGPVVGGMTLADICGVRPEVYREWKAKKLRNERRAATARKAAKARRAAK